MLHRPRRKLHLPVLLHVHMLRLLVQLTGRGRHHRREVTVGKIKDAAAKAKDEIKFLTESPKSEDFGKSKEDWKASKDAAKDGKGK